MAALTYLPHGNKASFVLLALFSLATCTAIHGGQARLVQPHVDVECGIGFDLTPTYGTSAVSCANGTSAPLSILGGSEQYKSLMQRLPLLDTNPHTPTEREKVSVLGHMLRDLRRDTEVRLGSRIHSAGTTVPWVSGLGRYVGDRVVKEAFAVAGMHYIQLIPYQYSGEPVTLPPNSVLAGHGLALCQPYNTTTRNCTKKSLGAPVHYMLIGYYSDALEAALTWKTVSAYDIIAGRARNYQLGSNMIHRNPNEKYYWAEVEDLLINLFPQSRLFQPQNVICYGDSCDNVKLQKMVNETMDRFLGTGSRREWVFDGVDTRFAGALGTAELVLRHPYQ